MKKNNSTNSLFILAIIYTAFLILCNLTASKITHVGNYHFTSAIIFFPITYIIDDILTEIYGFGASRKLIWLGLLANLIVALGALIIIKLPVSEHSSNQAAFETVFGISFRMLIASALAYILGEFSNSIIMSALKVKMEGKYFAFRAISSTVIGAAFDTIIFMFSAFAFILPTKVIIEIIIVEYFIKLGIEILVLPITCKIVNFLKSKHNLDHFDYQESYNPFKL